MWTSPVRCFPPRSWSWFGATPVSRASPHWMNHRRASEWNRALRSSRWSAVDSSAPGSWNRTSPVLALANGDVDAWVTDAVTRIFMKQNPGLVLLREGDGRRLVLAREYGHPAHTTKRREVPELGSELAPVSHRTGHHRLLVPRVLVLLDGGLSFRFGASPISVGRFPRMWYT